VKPKRAEPSSANDAGSGAGAATGVSIVPLQLIAPPVVGCVQVIDMLAASPKVYEPVSSLAKVPSKSNVREPTEVEVVGVNPDVATLVKSKSTVSSKPEPIPGGAPKFVWAVAISEIAVGELFPTGKLKLLSCRTLNPAIRNPGGCAAEQPPVAAPQKLFGLPRYGSTKVVTVPFPGKAVLSESKVVVLAISPVSTLLPAGQLKSNDPLGITVAFAGTAITAPANAIANAAPPMVVI